MTALRQEDDAPRGFVPRSELYRAHQRIEALEAEIAELKSRLHDAVDPSLVSAALMMPGMSGAPARLLAALREARAPLDYRKLIALGAIGTRRQFFDAECNFDNTLKVQMHRVRRALRDAGCPGGVKCIPGVGYTLTEEARQWLDKRDYGGNQK